MQTSGHKVLVTGGTRGIGLAIAERFAAHGNRVVIVGSSEDSVSQAQKTRPDWDGYACDLGSLEAREALIGWIKEHHPDLSVLVNNAGIQHDQAISEGNLQALRQEIAINVEAVVHLCQGLADTLATSSESGVINVSSGLAIAPKASAPVYCASKAFIRSYCVTLRYQLESAGTRVFDLAPPLVKTDMTAGRNEGGLSADSLVDQLWRAWVANRYYIPAGQSRLLEMAHRLSPGLARRIARDL